ncbi:MAG: hypothetical protein AB1656_09410 [Candidatus Omnitrophota bacterium]
MVGIESAGGEGGVSLPGAAGILARFDQEMEIDGILRSAEDFSSPLELDVFPVGYLDDALAEHAVVPLSRHGLSFHVERGAHDDADLGIAGAHDGGTHLDDALVFVLGIKGYQGALQVEPFGLVFILDEIKDLFNSFFL